MLPFVSFSLHCCGWKTWPKAKGAQVYTIGAATTHEAVGVQRAFASRRTLDVAAVPRAGPEAATVTLRSAHHLSHWGTGENGLD